MTLKLSMKHCLCKYYQHCSNYDPGLTLTYFTPRSNLITWAFLWVKVKIIYCLETIAALGLKVARSIQLNELMKLSEYQRSRSFFDLGQMSLRFQSLMFDFGLYTQVSNSGPHGPLVLFVK